ncbi:adenosylcobinamide-GDP ribazoletransferase [Vogesella urethralis]|uniref:adenosylcobinamide-GDP ribazoletransferase n=1 Tax=Vogesella urethralis TaxID=2592656 RepID=UPI001184DC7F|nr:adenosylcobinamide-GDP ribazoletransferase [Vogesella urethralis]MEC5205432.1 adenosylcobinamide-GDP ribazoletransferase [Vogesella perlucida]
MRSLILAIQFLTRLPTPQLKTFDPAWLADAARWFAPVGVLVGAIVWLAVLAGSLVDPWLAALAGLLAWLWVTGGLHIDGLADLADAQGAAHRSRERFLEVLKDPHLGSFGVLSLATQLIVKLVLLMLLVKLSLAGLSAVPDGMMSPGALPSPDALPLPVSPDAPAAYPGYHSGHGQHGGQAGIAALTGLAATLAGLLLVPAWARLFTVAWSATLPSLAAGSGERFAWRPHWPSFWLCSLLLAAASAWLAPVLLLAPLAGLCWWAYLKRKLGGMTGDCLGAGIEVCESLLLLALVVAAR